MDWGESIFCAIFLLGLGLGALAIITVTKGLIFIPLMVIGVVAWLLHFLTNRKRK